MSKGGKDKRSEGSLRPSAGTSGQVLAIGAATITQSASFSGFGSSGAGGGDQEGGVSLTAKKPILLFENEIELSREVGDWKQVLEYMDKNAQRLGAVAKGGTSTASPLANFIFAEANFELWLEDHQPVEKNITKAKSGLIDFKKTLLLCLNAQGWDTGCIPDAHILLGKIYYCSGLYEEAISELEKTRFEQLAEAPLSVRNLILMAEAYAMKSHSLEKIGRFQASSQTADEKHIAISVGYRRAAELAITYFQRIEKILNDRQLAQSTSGGTLEKGAVKDKDFDRSSTSVSSKTPLTSTTGGQSLSSSSESETSKKPRGNNSIIEMAIRRGPAYLLETLKTESAVRDLQWMLRSQDTQFFSPLRLSLARRLAEILLRFKFIPPMTNPNPIMSDPANPNANSNGQQRELSSPSRIKYYTGKSIFSPGNMWEEAFLLLLYCESLVVRDGVLNRTTEFSKARQVANQNTASVFDLLTLALGRWSNFSLINEMIERTLKYSFEEPHIWTLYALSFHGFGYNSRKSVKTTLTAAELVKKPVPLLLLAVQQEFLRFRVKEGQEILEKAKGQIESQPKMHQRVHLYEGIGLFLRSFEKYQNSERIKDLEDAASSLQKALDLDSMDYLTYHWAARVQAWLGNINESFNYAISALKLDPFHIPTIQLIVLLLSAQRSYVDAMSVCEEALDEYPEHLGFLQMKAAIEEECFGPELALMTVKQMLLIWKHLFEETLNGDLNGGNGGGRRSESPDFKPNNQFGLNLQLPSPTTGDTASVASFRAASIAGSSNTGTLTAGLRAESALSEIASSLSLHGSLTQLQQSEDLAWRAQITIWTMLADIYLKMEQPKEAAAAIEEAALISSVNPDVLFYRGLVSENIEKYGEARVIYECAVAVKPTHVKSLQHLALMQHYFGSHRLAEKTLQDSLRLEPYNHLTWYNLGKVLEALGELSEAGDCMATALEIEANAPILPYSSIPICFE